jgi:hypothetical protein
LLALFPILAQAGSLRPGLPRVTWSTDHFTLTIDEKKQDLLPALGSLAEECYAKEKVFFGFEPPGKIQMMFLDEQDYANGFAYSPQEWVVIYLHGAEHRLRGRTRWLPAVISHELGHIFTLRKMGEDSRFLGVEAFHDWLGASGSRFHEGLDWSNSRIPPWLAEGLAQYAAGVCGYDTLDTHRQMILRVAAASGSLMTLAELKGFAWDARRNEMLYTQGYSLVSYLYRGYGPTKANRFLELCNGRNWRAAFRPAFGKDLAEIYADWRKTLENRSRPEDAAGNGDYLLPEPEGAYTVETSPAPLDNGTFLFLSSRDNDYGNTDLFLSDGKGSATRVFRDATSLRAAAGGQAALFTATRFAFTQAAEVSELYRYDAGSGAVERLTHGGRVVRGCENQGIVYGVRNDQGRTSLIRIADGEFTTVYTPPDSMELTDVAAGHSAGTLILGTTSGFGGDLYELDLGTREIAPLAVSPQDERDPLWVDGTLYFSADYGGVFDIYAQKDGQVERITHVSGGAFHPALAVNRILFSSYGWKGFRLAGAEPLGAAAPSFVVELPVPAWKAPPPAEYEADTFDRTNLGFLGFDLKLGMYRNPGYHIALDSAVDSTGNGITIADGSKAVAGIGLHWLNPTGVASAFLNLGLSKPIDYKGPNHVDETGFGLRLIVFLPAIVLGGSWNTYDFPDFTVAGNTFVDYQRVLYGYAGLDWRLAEHWSALTQFEAQDNSEYAGDQERKVYDSDPQYGGYLRLQYSNLDQGKDGVIRGMEAYADGEIPPPVSKRSPDYSASGGVTLYTSLQRLLYLKGSLFYTMDMGGRSDASWGLGRAEAFFAIPLGLQIGTRGGAGLFLDQAYPEVDYSGLGTLMRPESGGSGYQASYLPSDSRSGSGLMPWGQFRTMLDRQVDHEVGVGLTLKTLSFSANQEYWHVGARFDAADFGRDPVWTVTVTF